MLQKYMKHYAETISSMTITNVFSVICSTPFLMGLQTVDYITSTLSKIYVSTNLHDEREA